jgi:DNA-binding CsgD family transcriptional regulator
MAAVLAKLPERDLRACLGALQSLAEQSTDSASFVTTALEALTGVISSELTTLSVCDLEQGTRRVVGRKGESLSRADRAAFDKHFREHPLVRFHSSHPGGPTQRISDCMAAQAFRHSALHADYYRRIGINYVMALPLRIDDANVISMVFNRGGSDFTGSERAMADAVRQPLAAIYRNLLACEDAGVGLKCINQLANDGGWQMMRVTLSGRTLDASPTAMSWLNRFFPESGNGRQIKLPAALFEWFARSRNWGLERPAINHGRPFTLSRLGFALRVHFIPDPDDSSAGYLLMKVSRVELQPADLAHLPMTEREREILALVTAGKTNGEIGTIQAISARTFQKHLEHIFQKLGVESRTAAAVRALGTFDAQAPMRPV